MQVEQLTWKATELAEALRVSRSKAYEMMASGEVPTIVIGGVRRVVVAGVKQRIADQLGTANKDGQ